MKAKHTVLLLAYLALNAITYGGTTGKISGRVLSGTGEPLVGANILVEGTLRGSSTDIDGYYAILNILPGDYRLKVSLIGYKTQTIASVHVDVDQTTTIDVSLIEETILQDVVEVIATRPVVQKDVSNSRANISAIQVEQLPVSTVASVVGLEAGVQTTSEGQFVIRGGAADQTSFVVNGLNLRDARDNTPFTNVSITSIEAVQVQTGGFNAEYGNIRSGLVNVSTKEGGTSGYTFSFFGRYSPTKQKYFGSSLYDQNSYYLRPYLDAAVAWTGTNNGAWDQFTQNQYQNFVGWNAISAGTLRDNDPTNDLTPEAAQRLFLWEHRKRAAITDSDYGIDMSFGGPVPGGRELGNLRFFGSYRQDRSMYLFPLSDDANRTYTGQLKLTSDFGKGMKLSIEGLVGRSTGTTDNQVGLPGTYTSPGTITDGSNRNSFLDAIIFGYDYWARTLVDRRMVGGKFTHMVSSTTFYTATVQWFQSEYNTGLGRLRDTSRVYLFGNAFYVDESPFGFPTAVGRSGIGSRMNMDLGWAGSRDSSLINSYLIKGDVSSQLDRYNEVKAGIELNLYAHHTNYATVDPRFNPDGTRTIYSEFPVQGAAYIQDKLEFEGMIANLGARVDYSDAASNWFVYNLYDPLFAAPTTRELDSLRNTPTKKIVTISPRLGIAFPITEVSKLFFNYGHFRSLPDPEHLFQVRLNGRNGALDRLPAPNNPLPKTVAYELGYEHSLFDEYLLRVAGYYKDVTNETQLVRYTSSDSRVNYQTYTDNRYRDIRGFEITASRNRGKWVQGFINYTYDVRTTGYFGFDNYFQNRVDQREEEAINVPQSKPVPTPYARLNINVLSPQDFGPEIGSHHILGDWLINLLGSWNSGFYFAWAGGGGTPANAELNVQWKDTYSFNLRLAKNFHLGPADVQFFMDINNLFNLEQMNNLGFVNTADFDQYMRSLHLPAEIAGDPSNPKLGYANIPGNDRPGDFRSVPYEPYDPNDPDESRKQRILDTKAYIDMPNIEQFAFLNPRDIFYGLRFSFNF